MKMSNSIPRNPKVDVNGKVWDKEKVKLLLQTDTPALYRAILRIFQEQTSAEQNTDTTQIINGLGFTGFDAEILSSFAKQIQARGGLTAKQIEIARGRMQKYACQLLYLSKEDQMMKGGNK